MPSITTWNRLEPRARSLDLKEGLEARVHDPLWFLARQWQTGEFEGRNTGSPAVASVQFSVAPLDRFSVAGQAPQPYDIRKPIEVSVEQEAVRAASDAADYRQASEAGLHFARLLSAAQVPAAILSLYLAQYPLAQAGRDAAGISSVMAGRVIDGIKLHTDLMAAGNSLPAAPAIPTNQQVTVLAVTRDWLAWYASLFSEPAQAGGGWSNDRMEYSFAMSAAGGADAYTAQEYDGGSVDWYTFNRSANAMPGGTAQPTVSSKTVFATPVVFRGMPARRFWEMEDASTNVGQLSAAAEDLGRILLREFTLIYANDWFQFPLVIPVGSLVEIKSLSVSDTFGVPTDIPHYSAVDGAAAKWRLFSISADPAADAVSSAAVPHPLLLVPGAVAPVDGAAIEEVLLLRDELANMVWGIERIVAGASGQPLDRTTEWNTNLPAAPPPAAGAPLSYRLGSTVPDYWTPYQPVTIDPAKGLKLRRGRLPTAAAAPVGRLLLNLELFLEEVPREGVLLMRHYRYARGPGGTAYLWMGRQRNAGKGEGRSGLRFDFVE